MKQITELTEKEILALTDDQLLTMIRYKMAEEGIKILDKPIAPEYRTVPVKDDIAFAIGGIQYYTKDEKAAKEISALILKYGDKFLNANFTSNYDHNYLKPMDEYSIRSFGKIEEQLFYTQERITAVNDVTAANKVLKEKYEASLKEFNDAEDAANYIRIDIYARYNEVRDKYANMEQLKHMYSVYLALANGDTVIAMNFLKKAYSVHDEAEYFVQGREMPTTIGDPA